MKTTSELLFIKRFISHIDKQIIDYLQEFVDCMNKIYEDSINKELQQIEHMKVIITLFSDLND